MAHSPCYFGVTNEKNVYQVSFELTNFCNLNCQHCCNDSSLDGTKGLSKQEIFNLVDDLKHINTISIYLTGGEPTTHPDFVEIIKYIHKQGIDLVLATNGFDIKEYLGVIKQYVSHQAGVFISLDGLEDVHDELRAVKGAFNNTINTIKMLLDKDIPTRVSAIVWEKNFDQLPDFIKRVKDLGVYHLHFSMPFLSGRAKDNNISINQSQYKVMVNSLHKLLEKYSDDKFGISLCRDKYLDASSEACQAGSKIIHINSRGQMFPCSWVEKSALGAEYGVQWEKGNIDFCLKRVNRFKELVDQRVTKHGFSGCPAVAISYHGDEMAPDPINNLLK